MILIKKSPHMDSLFTAYAARVGLYFLLLIFTVFYQIKSSHFINLKFLIPTYGFLTLSFAVSLVLFFLGFKKRERVQYFVKHLINIDVFVVSCLLYMSGFQSSLYLFFYVYLIFISALLNQQSGAYLTAAISSFFFSCILFFDQSVASNSKVFLFLINNTSFFVVAYLGGGLSNRVEELGAAVVIKDKSIKELKDINQLIIDNVNSGLITIDENYRVIQYNHEAFRMFSELELDRVLYDIIPELKEKLGKLFEFQRKLKEENIYFEILFSKIQIEDEFKGGIILVQDVTAKKNLEERAKTQEKLAAVGQLAAGIAHEIRNPLASMSGSIQLLASSFENLDAEQKKLIAITLKETDRLNLLISEFLEFVRPKIELNDRVDLAKLINEVVEMIQWNQSLKKPQFQLDIESGIYIQGNRDKLKQVFLNILINGCHAMDSVEGPFYLIRLRKIKNDIEIVFQDNGVGMNSQIKQKMFEPFFTTKSKGTGLGLALVHKIIELHEASIDVDSEVGKGTQFRIIFKNKN